jgi:hypothetical protein
MWFLCRLFFIPFFLAKQGISVEMCILPLPSHWKMSIKINHAMNLTNFISPIRNNTRHYLRYALLSFLRWVDRVHSVVNKTCFSFLKFLPLNIIYTCTSTALQPFVGHWPFFQFLSLYTVGRTPWTGDQSVARPLPVHRTTRTQNKRKQKSIPWLGFETTIPAFELAKKVHALDRAATVTGFSPLSLKFTNWGNSRQQIIRMGDSRIFKRLQHTSLENRGFERPQKWWRVRDRPRDMMMMVVVVWA